MNHFACTGSCGGENSQAGVCEAEFCSKEGQELLSCDCGDGLHENAGKKMEEENPDLQ